MKESWIYMKIDIDLEPILEWMVLHEILFLAQRIAKLQK